MGPVNPLALEEHDALRERHEFLGDQLEDIRNSRRDLRKVIRSIDDEIASVFAEAFAEVSTHFTDLFDTLPISASIKSAECNYFGPHGGLSPSLDTIDYLSLIHI